MHLIIDGYGSDPKILRDEKLLTELLDSLPSQIGMTKISPPFVTKYIGAQPEDWGLSGFVVIAESHISVHTFVERCYVNIDVFSCKDFDARKVIINIKSQFKLTKLRSYLVDRDWVVAPIVSLDKLVELCSYEE